MAPRLWRNILSPSSGQSRLEAGRLVHTVHTSVDESGVMLVNTHIIKNVILPKHNNLAPLSASVWTSRNSNPTTYHHVWEYLKLEQNNCENPKSHIKRKVATRPFRICTLQYLWVQIQYWITLQHHLDVGGMRNLCRHNLLPFHRA